MSDDIVSEKIETVDDRVSALVRRPLTAGVLPDLTAPSIFFHGVTAHTYGPGGFSLSLEVERASQALDGSLVSERAFAGVVRCASVEALRQLRCSIDLLVLAVEKGDGAGAPN